MGVVTWGDRQYTGDISSVQDQLCDVQSITATCRAFAALRSDGTVVTWGHRFLGGDSSSVQDQLDDIQNISSTVITWGARNSGGDSSSVQGQLHGIQRIISTYNGFIAVRIDGTKIRW